MSKQTIYQELYKVIGNAYGVIGAMCNIKAESGFKSTNMQNSYEAKTGYNDVSYTNAVDNGSYKGFTSDRIGYGLCQWTSSGRKQGLLNYAQSKGISIGNEKMQVEYLLKELSTAYKYVLDGLMKAKSIKEASDLFMTKFERPADQSEVAKSRRASVGESLWNELVKENDQVKKHKVALSDGHGLETAGKRTPYLEVLGREFKENEFNSPVIKMISEMLSKYDEFEPLEVAPTDKDTPLSERIKLANDAGAELYVSVHANAFDGSFEGHNPKGISVFCYPGSKNGTRMANILLKHLMQGTEQVSRGVKEEMFYELRKTHMAAVLSENLFMDNPEEALLMIDPDFQREVAIEHVKAICEYFGVTYKEDSNKETVEVETDKIEGKYYIRTSKVFDDLTIAKATRNELDTMGLCPTLMNVIE